MKLSSVFFATLLVALPVSSSADSFLHDRSVKYAGKASAIGVCRAVVEDDLRALEQQLARYRSRLTFGYNYRTTDRMVYGSFSCNEKDLLTFAEGIGAESISGYLKGGYVTVEEYISSID